MNGQRRYGVCGIHIMEYYLDIKENEILSFVATWMDLEIEKHKHYMISHIWNLKNNTNKLIYKTDSQTLKKNLWLPEGKEVGGKIT